MFNFEEGTLELLLGENAVSVNKDNNDESYDVVYNDSHGETHFKTFYTDEELVLFLASLAK